MDDLYREELLMHYKSPRHFGKPEKFDLSFEKDNPYCGDKLHVYLQVKEDRVTGIYFTGEGCAVSVAAASILTSALEGKTKAEIMAFGTKELLETLKMELTPTRLKCALLPLETIHQALNK